MTYQIMRVSSFVCDSCDVDFEDLGSKAQVWPRARQDGWTEQPGGQHHCPKCSAEQDPAND